MAAVLPAGQAIAACLTDTGTTDARVAVSAAIVLSNLTPEFTLSGIPGDTPEEIGAVTMHVQTNNATGYNVTVQAAAPDLVGTGTNTDTIPVIDLSVRQTNTTTYTALSDTAPVQVHNQATRSADAPGDLLSNDYEFNTPIPHVNSDIYSVTLDYVATINP